MEYFNLADTSLLIIKPVIKKALKYNIYFESCGTWKPHAWNEFREFILNNCEKRNNKVKLLRYFMTFGRILLCIGPSRVNFTTWYIEPVASRNFD